jgi:hypothetical protein
MLTPALAIIARTASEADQFSDPVEFLKQAIKSRPPKSFALQYQLSNGVEDPIDVKTRLLGKLYKDGDGFTYRYVAPTRLMPKDTSISLEVRYSTGSQMLVLYVRSSNTFYRPGFSAQTWILELTGKGDPKRLFKVLFVALNNTLNSPRGLEFAKSTMWNEVD